MISVILDSEKVLMRNAPLLDGALIVICSEGQAINLQNPTFLQDRRVHQVGLFLSNIMHYRGQATEIAPLSISF